MPPPAASHQARPPRAAHHASPPGTAKVTHDNQQQPRRQAQAGGSVSPRIAAECCEALGHALGVRGAPPLPLPWAACSTPRQHNPRHSAARCPIDCTGPPRCRSLSTPSGCSCGAAPVHSKCIAGPSQTRLTPSPVPQHLARHGASSQHDVGGSRIGSGDTPQGSPAALPGGGGEAGLTLATKCGVLSAPGQAAGGSPHVRSLVAARG